MTRLALAQHVGSLAALERQLAYEAISDDPEDYHRCIARERTLEIEACREMCVPCFFILDSEDSRLVHVSGQGGQSPYRKHTLYDATRQPVASLAGYEVLVRASVGHEKTCLKFVEEKGGVNVADWPSQALTLEWYKHVQPEFLKRKFAWYPMDGVFSRDLSAFKDEAGRFFCKTNYKALSGLTDNLVDLLGYSCETMPPSTEIVISEPLEIAADSLGKREYRCFIMRGRVSSISRYIDYNTDYAIPASIEQFSADFVAAYIGKLPGCYVLDVAESDRGAVVIELNGIVASGRYEKNCPRKMLVDLEKPLDAAG